MGPSCSGELGGPQLQCRARQGPVEWRARQGPGNSGELGGNGNTSLLLLAEVSVNSAELLNCGFLMNPREHWQEMKLYKYGRLHTLN